MTDIKTLEVKLTEEDIGLSLRETFGEFKDEDGETIIEMTRSIGGMDIYFRHLESGREFHLSLHGALTQCPMAITEYIYGKPVD